MIALSSLTILAACQKVDMAPGIDIQKYESQLITDYSNASVSHKALSGVSADSHVSHHSGPSTGTQPNELMMFNKNDSLFSEHFYEFCIEMMKNQNQMSTNGMMGSTGMMESTGMMGNHEMMSGTKDLDEMLQLMENHHTDKSEMMNNDYYKVDSLMYANMAECKMMKNGTEGISAIFNQMQELRFEHRTLHNNF